MQFSKGCQLEDISEFLINQRFHFAAKTVNFLCLESGGGWCWAGMGIRRPACCSELCQLPMRRSKLPPVSEASVSSSEKWVACVRGRAGGWGVLLDDPLARPVLKFGNLICPSLILSTLWALPSPQLLTTLSFSSYNLHLSCQSGQSSPGQRLWRKHPCIPGRRQSSDAPYCKSSPSLGWREGQPKCVFLLWGLGRRAGVCSWG